MRENQRPKVTNPFPQTQMPENDPVTPVFALLSGIFGLIGLGLLVGAFFVWQNQKEFVRSTVPGTGTVLRHVERRSRDSKTGRVSITYAPVIEFKTSNGKIREFTSSVSSYPPDNRVGDSVSLVYDPRDPSKAEVNNFFSLWIGPVICGFLGVVFSGVGIGLFAVGQKFKAELKS